MGEVVFCNRRNKNTTASALYEHCSIIVVIPRSDGSDLPNITKKEKKSQQFSFRIELVPTMQPATTSIQIDDSPLYGAAIKDLALYRVSFIICRSTEGPFHLFIIFDSFAPSSSSFPLFPLFFLPGHGQVIFSSSFTLTSARAEPYLVGGRPCPPSTLGVGDLALGHGGREGLEIGDDEFDGLRIWSHRHLRDARRGSEVVAHEGRGEREAWGTYRDGSGGLGIVDGARHHLRRRRRSEEGKLRGGSVMGFRPDASRGCSWR